MAKGYWIARVSVDDPEAYKGYVETAKAAFEKYGARFLARGGRYETLEGKERPRTVVIEFADYDTALACYRSEEYQKALRIRQSASEADLVIVEGYDGPQPGAA